AFLHHAPLSQNGAPKIQLERKTKFERHYVPIIVCTIILLVIGLVVYQLCNPHKFWNTKPIHDPEMEHRRQFVAQMAQESWTAYVKYAWTHDGLRPLTKDSFDSMFGKSYGLGIVSAMSTLFVMGLREEFEKGRKWIAEELNFGAIKKDVDVHHSVNYYIGGLMSCYALTGDEMFVNKSREIADIL